MLAVQVQEWKVEAALQMSAITYGVQPDRDSEALRRFRDSYSLRSEVCFCCTEKGQKYCLSIVERNGEVVLFCAFAGTHLPGDWETTNLKILHQTDDEHVGAPCHAGFLQRAVDVPLEGIERLAVEQGVSNIVFCGHSLGGSVSHLCLVRWLFGLKSTNFAQDSVVSLGFGSPFFGGDEMLDHIKKHGWLPCFITLVNGNDPVPWLMNMAANMLVSTVSAAFSALLTACTGFLCEERPSIQKLATVSRQLECLPSPLTSEEVDTYGAYVPIGHYVLFPPDDGQVQLNLDTQKTNFWVGPPKLLHDCPSIITGLQNKNSVAHHHLVAYQSIFQARKKDMKGVWAKEDFSLPRLMDSGESKPILLKSEHLAPMIYDIWCETFSNHHGQPVSRIYNICGLNLDFCGGNAAVSVDLEQSDTLWSQGKFLITRRNKSVLVLEQNLASTKAKQALLPQEDIQIEVRSDVVVSPGGSCRASGTLHRKHCRSLSLPQSELRFYGGQFFIDTQQEAWIMAKLFHDDRLTKELSILATKLKQRFWDIRNTDYLELDDECGALEDIIGNPRQKNAALKSIYSTVVPPDGILVRTKSNFWLGIGIGAASLLLGGGVIALGGLGVIGGLVGSGGSLTGGYGTASLLVSSGLGTGFFAFRHRFRSDYSVMLEDLVKTFTGIQPQGLSELELEAALFTSVEIYDEVKECLPATGIPTLRDYDEKSQVQILERVDVIRSIHAIKKIRASATIITVCGPRDSGKTTLMSQLLQDPKLALSTGRRGGQQETRQVTPYKLQGITGYALLDTPGLTGPEEKIRDKFVHAALNLSSVFVYIRRYDGLPTETDVETITRILQRASCSNQPKVLICLNQGLRDLTRDAIGDLSDSNFADEVSAELLKKEWLSRLNELKDGSENYLHRVKMLWSRSRIDVEFVELDGDSEYELRLSTDPRTKGVWTTSSIGRWISNMTQQENDSAWNSLQNHLGSFSYQVWKEGVLECRRQRREELKMSEQIATAMRDAL